MKRTLKLLGVLVVAGTSLAGAASRAQSQVFCPQHCIFKCIAGDFCCKVDGCFGCHQPAECGS